MKCVIFDGWMPESLLVIIISLGKNIVHFVPFSPFFFWFVCLFFVRSLVHSFVAGVKVWMWCKQSIHKQLWLIICVTQLKVFFLLYRSYAIANVNIETTTNGYQMDQPNAQNESTDAVSVERNKPNQTTADQMNESLCQRNKGKTHERIARAGRVQNRIRCHLTHTVFHWNRLQNSNHSNVKKTKSLRKNKLSFTVDLMLVRAWVVVTSLDKNKSSNISWWHCHFCHGQYFISSFHWCTDVRVREHVWHGLMRMSAPTTIKPKYVQRTLQCHCKMMIRLSGGFVCTQSLKYIIRNFNEFFPSLWLSLSNSGASNDLT